MRTVKRVYDLESYELDNVYNETDEHEIRVDSSVWYN